MASSYQCMPQSGDDHAAVYSDMALSTACGQLYAGASVTVVNQTDTAFEILFPTEDTGPIRWQCSNTKFAAITKSPGTNDIIGRLQKGNTVIQLDEVTDPKYANTWLHIETADGLQGYVKKSSMVQVGGPMPTVWIAAMDLSEEIEEDNADDYNDWMAASDQHLEHFTNYSFDPSDPQNMDYWNERIATINRCFGCPPKFNMDVDVQYESVGSGIGRVMATTFYSNPTILSICPGKVQLFPSLFGVKKDMMMDSLIEAATGNGASSLASKIASDDGAKFTGKMYNFASDTKGFANRVNLLCRACAVLLGIGDTNMPNTTTKLKNFDYAYWSIRKAYTPGAGDSSGDKSIFADFWNAGKSAVEGAVTDKNYIHFIVSNSTTQVSESITTDVSPNTLMETLRGSVNSATSTLSYFLNTGFNETQDLSEALSEALTGVVGANGWSKLAENLMKGGQMVFPSQITGASFSQSVSCSINFVSPYGDPLSIFLWCIVPVMHLYALALPKQVADNTFTFPFICRVTQKGWFNSNLACITDLNVQRGGSDDTSWTVEGLATDWVVSFSIVPLINQLMVTSTENPFLFMKNDGLIDYLGNLCSFDLKANNAKEKLDLFTAFATNTVQDFFSLNRMQRSISDALSKKITDIFQF